VLEDRPAISRVGSGGWPGLSVEPAPNRSLRNRQSIVAASLASERLRSTIWSSRALKKSL
jgi:hypothetical protein